MIFFFSKYPKTPIKKKSFLRTQYLYLNAPDLIIYHAWHLKMVDVHFLTGAGGSKKVCFLYTLENV